MSSRQYILFGSGYAGLGNTLMVWGIVTFESDGSPTAASGTGNFTIDSDKSDKSGGLFNVVFDPTVNFSSKPTVVVTQIHNGDSLDSFDLNTTYTGDNTKANALVIAVSKTQFRLVTGDGHGNQENRMFSFIAVGPGTMDVSDSSITIAYANVGYSGNALKQISGLAGYSYLQWCGEKSLWLPPGKAGSNSGVQMGTYAVEPIWSNPPVLIVQEIYAGENKSDDISDFSYDGGDLRSNAVVDSVSPGFIVFTAGNPSGDREARIVGWILVGTG